MGRVRRCPGFEGVRCSVLTQAKVWPITNCFTERQPHLAVDETVILLTRSLSLSITIDAPAKGRGGVQQNDSLVNG